MPCCKNKWAGIQLQRTDCKVWYKGVRNLFWAALQTQRRYRWHRGYTTSNNRREVLQQQDCIRKQPPDGVQFFVDGNKWREGQARKSVYSVHTDFALPTFSELRPKILGACRLSRQICEISMGVGEFQKTPRDDEEASNIEDGKAPSIRCWWFCSCPSSMGLWNNSTAVGERIHNKVANNEAAPNFTVELQPHAQLLQPVRGGFRQPSGTFSCFVVRKYVLNWDYI